MGLCVSLGGRRWLWPSCRWSSLCALWLKNLRPLGVTRNCAKCWNRRESFASSVWFVTALRSSLPFFAYLKMVSRSYTGAAEDIKQLISALAKTCFDSLKEFGIKCLVFLVFFIFFVCCRKSSDPLFLGSKAVRSVWSSMMVKHHFNHQKGIFLASQRQIRRNPKTKKNKYIKPVKTPRIL